MSLKNIGLICMLCFGVGVLLGRDSDPLKSRKAIARTVASELHLPPPMIEIQKTIPRLDHTNKEISRDLSNDTMLNVIKNSNENMTLLSYIDLVSAKNITFTSGTYEVDLSRLETLITQSRYDFDLSMQGFASGSQLPTPTEGLGTTINGRVGIQANKLLYNGQRHYAMNEYSTLMKRLANFKRLSIRNQATLYATGLYLRLLELQTRQQYIRQYQEINDELYQKTMQKIERGVGDNIYEQMNIKMDKLALEKLVLGVEYDLHDAMLSFKQAAYISSNETISLSWPSIDAPSKSNEELQQSAIVKNNFVEMADAQFRLKKGELLDEQGKSDWIINFNSFGGIGYSNTITNISNTSSQGINWLVSLQAVYPLNYSASNLAVEKKTIEALNEKSNLAIVQQNTLMRVNKLSTDIARENQLLKLISMEKELAERHFKIVRYRFEAGLEVYPAYAESMKKTIEIEENILAAKIRLMHNILELQVLTGDLD